MAMMKHATLGQVFSTRGLGRTGTLDGGKFGFVELVGADRATLSIAFPPTGAQAIANRIVAAMEMAEHQRVNGEQPTDIASPLITDQTVDVTTAGDMLVLTLSTSTVPMTFRLSKSRAAKLRAALEAAEAKLEGAADGTADGA
ncbi:MAG: hypothetical protein ACWA6X_04990 [Bauldia sp.]|jgi:hypothetical protein